MDNRVILIVGAVAAAIISLLLYSTTSSSKTSKIAPITAKVTLGNRTVTVKGPGARMDWSWLSNLISGIGGNVSGTGYLPKNNPITGNSRPSPGAPSPPPGPAPVPTPVPNDWNGQVVTYTNAARVKQGLPQLIWNQKLAQIATNFAADMNRRQFRSHRDPEGRQPWDRARQQGYPSSFVGENLAWGAQGPREAANQWLSSPGHRANIMNRQYRQIGVGVVMGKVNSWNGRFSNANGVPYWVQLFSD
jgi:uncharacterized protein YkwD